MPPGSRSRSSRVKHSRSHLKAWSPSHIYHSGALAYFMCHRVGIELQSMCACAWYIIRYTHPAISQRFVCTAHWRGILASKEERTGLGCN